MCPLRMINQKISIFQKDADKTIGFTDFFFSVSMKLRLQNSKITTDLEQYDTELKSTIISNTSRNIHHNNEFCIPY